MTDSEPGPVSSETVAGGDSTAPDEAALAPAWATDGGLLHPGGAGRHGAGWRGVPRSTGRRVHL